MKNLSYAIYSQQGEHNREDGSVGITMPPTTVLTRSEINVMIDVLQGIADAMRAGSDLPRHANVNLDLIDIKE